MKVENVLLSVDELLLPSVVPNKVVIRWSADAHWLPLLSISSFLLTTLKCCYLMSWD